MLECPECGTRYASGTTSCEADGAGLVPEGQDPLLGRTVGSYTITKRLGRGGMGAVYLAEHPTIGSKVAVKFLHRRYAADRGIVDRFFNEARAVNLIGHDNIVKVSDLSELDDGSPYFIMEFLEGRPLAALVGTPQPLDVAGPIFLQVADGLQAAHDKNIIHRDLKPDNLFLVTRGRRANVVKIVDFGIAKLHGAPGASGRTQTGMVMGTAQYMSPEQAGGEVHRIGPGSDVYALGVIMFQLATGRLPFEGANFGELLVGHLMRPPPEPRSLEPSVPAAYEALILRCLAKKPEDRFHSMAEVYDALGDVLDSLGIAREAPVARSAARSDPGGLPAVDSRPPLATPPTTGPNSGPNGTVAMSGARITRPTPPVRDGATVVIPGAASKPPATAQKKAPVAAIAAALVLLGGGVAATLLLKPKEAPVAAVVATPPPAPAPVAPSVEQPPARPVLTITSTPAGATITAVQGSSTTTHTTPATVTVERGVEVSLRIASDGFVALDEKLTPTEDISLRYALQPVPVAVAAEAKPAPKAPRPAPPKTPAAEAGIGDALVDPF